MSKEKQEDKTSLNRYNVKAYLRGFHEIKTPQKILECELDFDNERKQYFISIIVSAESGEEAQGIGMEKIVDSKDQYSVNEKIILKKINEIIVWIKDHEEDHIFRRQLEERLGTLESAMLDEMKEGSGK